MTISGPPGLTVSINGGAYFPPTGEITLNPGQSIRLRSPTGAPGDARLVEVTVGGVTGTWQVLTAP